MKSKQAIKTRLCEGIIISAVSYKHVFFRRGVSDSIGLFWGIWTV